MTTEQWLNLLHSVGLPTFFLLALLMLCWRSMKTMTPFIKDAYDKHMHLVEDVSTSVQEQTNILKGMKEDTKKSRAALGHAADALEDLAPETNRVAVTIHTNRMKDSLEG